MPEDVTQFYETVAQVSFTLLGLWWLVIQTSREYWMADPSRRRTGYHLSLYFVLPGTMSLLSLLATEASALWNVGFAAAGSLGAAESLHFIKKGEAHRMSRGAFMALPLVVAIYALVTVIAVAPTLPSAVGLELSALVVEGILIAVLLPLGVNLAWLGFTRSDGSIGSR